jgi:hypothetical protein
MTIIVKYVIPENEKDELVGELGVDPFYVEDENDPDHNHWVIDETAIAVLKQSGIDIEAACQTLYGQSFIDRYPKDQDELRIHRVLPIEMDPLIQDFTVIGLRKQSPLYEKGRKTKAFYRDPNNDDLVVEKIFSDVVGNHKILNATGGFDEIPGITGLQVTFNWYKEDGTIGLTKTEIVKELTRHEAETMLRQRRERAMDYLLGGAKGTPIEPYMNTIFDHYYDSILKYKENGSSALADNINGEDNPAIIPLLNIQIPQSVGLVSVKQIILFEIS